MEIHYTESIRTLKKEFLWVERFENIEHAQKAVGEWSATCSVAERSDRPQSAARGAPASATWQAAGDAPTLFMQAALKTREMFAAPVLSFSVAAGRNFSGDFRRYKAMATAAYKVPAASQLQGLPRPGLLARLAV